MAGTHIWEVFSKVANNFWAGILKNRQQIGRYLRSRQFENTAKQEMSKIANETVNYSSAMKQSIIR